MGGGSVPNSGEEEDCLQHGLGKEKERVDRPKQQKGKKGGRKTISKREEVAPRGKEGDRSLTLLGEMLWQKEEGDKKLTRKKKKKGRKI